LFISTPKGFNHFYDLYNLEHKDPDFKSFHFTSFDNPHLPVDEINKAKLELTEDRFAQEYLADFRKTEGLVYKEFDREKHLFDDNTRIAVKDTIAGVDFGFTNPAAVLTIKIDLEDNYWLTNEYYQSGKTDAEIADYVSACKFNRVYPDPESPSAITELRRRGVNVRDVVKNADSIKNGITKIRELLKAGKLHVHKKCENTIFEFETYSYPDSKDGANDKEIPIKDNDHAMDALRYALYMQESSNPNKKAHTFIPKSIY
jgi:PBSX family phage terminase large subunit